MSAIARVDPLVVNVTIRVTTEGEHDGYLFQLAGIPDEPARKFHCCGDYPRDDLYAQLWKALRDIPRAASVQCNVLGFGVRWPIPYPFEPGRNLTEGWSNCWFDVDRALDADPRLDDPPIEPTAPVFSCAHATDETPAGACPFRADVDNDSETLCRCCADCEDQCGEDGTIKTLASAMVDKAIANIVVMSGLTFPEVTKIVEAALARDHRLPLVVCAEIEEDAAREGAAGLDKWRKGGDQ